MRPGSTEHLQDPSMTCSSFACREAVKIRSWKARTSGRSSLEPEPKGATGTANNYRLRVRNEPKAGRGRDPRLYGTMSSYSVDGARSYRRYVTVIPGVIQD